MRLRRVLSAFITLILAVPACGVQNTSSGPSTSSTTATTTTTTAPTTTTPPATPLITQIEQAGFVESQERIKGNTWTWVKGNMSLTLVQTSQRDYVINDIFVVLVGPQKAMVDCFSRAYQERNLQPLLDDYKVAEGIVLKAGLRSTGDPQHITMPPGAGLCLV